MITMYYDSDCVLCTTNAITMQNKAPDKINIVSVYDAMDSLNQHSISLAEAMTYVVVCDEFGTMHKGMNAVRLLYKTARIPFYQLLYLPVVKQSSDILYPIIAKNRYRIPKWAIKLLFGNIYQSHCDNGVCHIPPNQRQYKSQYKKATNKE